MRTVIGWMAALFASALLGAVVYETVLSEPALEPDASAYVETTTRNPTPGPIVYRTEVRKVVEPTPTVTVLEEIAVPAAQVAQPAPTRTSQAAAASPRPRATSDDRSAKASPSKSREDSERREAEDREDREDGEDDHKPEKPEDHESEKPEHPDDD